MNQLSPGLPSSFSPVGKNRMADQSRALASQQRRNRRLKIQDWIFEHATLCFALLVLLMLVAIIGSLMMGAAPALKHFGFAFFVSDAWNPVTKDFGAAIAIFGTLVTSAIALLIGVPVSFGIALFLTGMCPKSLKRPLGTAVGLLAGHPPLILCAAG